MFDILKNSPFQIAAIVSTLGVIASLLSSRWQLRHAFESLRQGHLKEILTKRMDAYPALWSVMLTYDLNWQIEGKEPDRKWAREFLVELNKCNAEYGVFFSERVYEKFHEFRDTVIKIEMKLSKAENITQDISALGTIALGLGTRLKDDLGSYTSTVFQLRRGNM